MKYRSPLFGQGAEPDNLELIPRLVEEGYTDNTHQIILPLETTDRTSPSAHKWWWRVRDWRASITHTTSGFGAASWEAVLSSFFTDERDIVNPTGFLSSYNAGRYRAWRADENDFGITVSDLIHNFTMHLCIGSFNDWGVSLEWPLPEELDDLFYEHPSGTFAPRITVRASWLIGDTTATVISTSEYAETAAIEIDGKPMTTASMFDDLHGSVEVSIAPDRFWTWDGRFDETTGARIVT